MNTTELTLLTNLSITALERNDTLKRVKSIEIKWIKHDKGECSEVFLPDCKIEFHPPEDGWDDGE